MKIVNQTYAQDAIRERIEVKLENEQTTLFQFHTDESYDDSDYYVDIEPGDY
jgi:hypothetical protein